jgi:hypothetical protein
MTARRPLPIVVLEGVEPMAVIRFSERTLRLIDGAPGSALSLDRRAFLADCEMRRLSPNTLRIYTTPLAAFHTWAHAKASEDVTPQDLRIYFLSLKEAGHNPGGQHQAFRVLKIFFRWIVAEGEMDANPMTRSLLPAVQVRFRVSGRGSFDRGLCSRYNHFSARLASHVRGSGCRGLAARIGHTSSRRQV